jgi:hypothetical protein
MNSAPPPSQPWHKGLPHYVLWFCIWGALFSFLQPVTSEQTAGTTFWAVKITQALFGAGFGVVCALVFAVLQNTFNKARVKWRSWLLAIGTWLTVNFSLAYVVGAFH